MKDKEKKICIVVKAFLKNPKLTNEEIAELTGISASSVQRYLNDPSIGKLFDEAVLKNVRELLEQRTIDGRRKGGINYFKNNEPIKNKNGQFIASKKTDLTNRLERKCLDILVFANIYLKNPNLSLQQIADFYNEYSPDDTRVITKDYVYDCLNDKKAYSLLADELYEIIKGQLSNRFNQDISKKSK